MEVAQQPEQRKAVMALIRQAMPRVAALVADLKLQHGEAWVAECQRRGLSGEPGWFYARDGAFSVGVPWADVREAEAWMEHTGALNAQAVVAMVRNPAEGKA